MQKWSNAIALWIARIPARKWIIAEVTCAVAALVLPVPVSYGVDHNILPQWVMYVTMGVVLVLCLVVFAGYEIRRYGCWPGGRASRNG